jgi:hypothetical protein
MLLEGTMDAIIIIIIIIIISVLARRLNVAPSEASQLQSRVWDSS